MNSYQQPQPGKAPRRFFTWVRSSGLIRGNDRWIGGVCSGIAQRLGWSPTLVRALMIVATLFFGFGAALYAMGWFLIPDVRSGQILAEDLIEGQWDWNCLGCFLFMAVAVLIPGAGWVCIALAALVLWLIAQSGVRQQEGYGFGYHGGQSTAPPNNPNGPNNPNNLAPNPSMQPSATMPPYVSQPVSQSVPYVSQPVPQAGQRPYNPTSSSAAMPVDGIPAGKYAMPNPVAAAAPRSSTRRKPAGPVVVLSVLGLSFISFAAVMAVIWEYDMDVSGIVRHVFSQGDPMGIHYHGFGKPGAEELDHDFLWRVKRELPKQGWIAVFDRSHYEDVVMPHVYGTYPEDVWRARYDQINEFERELAASGCAILKIFLVVSQDEQKKHFLGRLDDPTKYWKFDISDLEARDRWDDYMDAWQEVFEKTSTAAAPWYLVPADNRWYSRAVVSELLRTTLKNMNMTWPPLEPEVDPDEVRRRLA